MTNGNEEKTEQTFSNVLAVFEYLKKNGWKVGRSLVYEHRKDGMLRPRSDGLFHLPDIQKYISIAQLKNVNSSAVSDADKFYDEKVKADLDIAKEKLKQLQLKNQVTQGMFVPRDAFDRELAQRAMIFKVDIETFCRSQAGPIVNLVDGDKEKVPDLIEFMLASAARWLNSYSADRAFTVPAVAPADVLMDPDEEEE